MRGAALPSLMGAMVIVAFLTFLSSTLLPLDTSRADMRLSPTEAALKPGETLAVTVVVESPLPVNVFSGELRFDPAVLAVSSIDYNTSIADLWAEKPWYENGAGTINFTGGTTRSGGFVGTDTLLTIHFIAQQEGAGTLTIKDAHILEHNGLGTDTPLRTPIDALFTVSSSSATSTVRYAQDTLGTTYRVRTTLPSPDLNGDGKQTFVDVSIMLLNLASSDARYDLNGDGTVDRADLSFLMSL